MRRAYKYLGWGLSATAFAGGIVFAAHRANAASERPTPAMGDAMIVHPTGDEASPVDTRGGDGSVTGHVIWQGARPPMDPVPVTMAPEVCGKTSPFQALRLAADGGVEGAVVTLVGAPGSSAHPPPASVTVEQHGCLFTPHVSIVGTEGTLVFSNHDSMLHNVHAYRGGSTLFNIATISGSSTSKSIDDAGLIRLECDAGHTWMFAYIDVVDSGYAAVTDHAGAFRLDHVPPGSYTVHMWHEGWLARPSNAGHVVYSSPVTLDQKVDVPPGGSVTSDFALTSALAK